MQERVVAQLLGSIRDRFGLDRDDLSLLNRIVGVNVQIEDAKVDSTAEEIELS